MRRAAITDIAGNAIGGLASYTAWLLLELQVVGLLSATALMITVTVTGPDNLPVVLDGYPYTLLAEVGAMMMNRINAQGIRPNLVTCIFHLAICISAEPHGPPLRESKGFTLVEMIMVIVITGIIGGMVAVFLKAPIQQYIDVSRRADMTDIADTALRRIGRDVRLALPNSVQVHTSGSGTSTVYYLDFLEDYRRRALSPGAGWYSCHQ